MQLQAFSNNTERSQQNHTLLLKGEVGSMSLSDTVTTNWLVRKNIKSRLPGDPCSQFAFLVDKTLLAFFGPKTLNIASTVSTLSTNKIKDALGQYMQVLTCVLYNLRIIMIIGQFTIAPHALSGTKGS